MLAQSTNLLNGGPRRARRWLWVAAIVLILGLCINVSALCIGPDQTTAAFDASVLIGCWQDTPDPCSGLSDCYNFYEDHTFRFIYNQMTSFDRRYHMDGTWEIRDDAEIRIVLDSLTYMDGGEIAYNNGQGYHFRDGITKTEAIEPQWVWSFPIDQLNLHWDEWYWLKEYRCDYAQNGEFYEESGGETERPPLRKLQAAFFSKTQYWKIYDLPYYRNEEEETAFMEAMPD